MTGICGASLSLLVPRSEKGIWRARAECDAFMAMEVLDGFSLGQYQMEF
jgi:hypothetical protein